MDKKTLLEIWNKFIYDDLHDSRLNPYVMDSWIKCRAAGVDPFGGVGSAPNEKLLASIVAANSTLIKTALPIMQSVFEIVRDTEYLLVLTDSVGYILETMGDEKVSIRSRDMRFTRGVLWNSHAVGTNAISVALDYDTPIAMRGAEHYCKLHHEWTCSAAPIHGVDGEIIGCIDLSGDVDTQHEHSLALILAIAYGIETQLKLWHSAEIMRAALESSANGILLLGEGYCPEWANSVALGMFGFSEEKLKNTDFRTLVPDVDWSELDMHGTNRLFSDDVRVITSDGNIYCSIAIYPSLSGETKMLNVTLSKQKHLIKAVNKLSGNRARFAFDDLHTKAPEMKKTLALAKKYADYEGNILIEGEHGTGKELIAQAIHNASARASGPFVAVNCASLPRESLEEELFGYEAGASFGNRTEGNPGRFELANKGTLYLDGVNNLPLEFQSKLLRVVDTHTISRLGSTSSDISLDIRIIASSSKSLLQVVENGGFYRDLYDRLSVLKLDVPPLRQRRADISSFVLNMLEWLNASVPDMSKVVSEEFMDALINYEWPGNIRELQNGLERAFYACSGNVLDSSILSFVIDTSASSLVLRSNYNGEALRITRALEESDGDVALAAKKLEISRATMYRRLNKFGIDPKRSFRK